MKWGLGIEHEIRLRFEKTIHELSDNIRNKYFKQEDSNKYIFINSEYVLYNFYLYGHLMTDDLTKNKNNLFQLAKKGLPFPLDVISKNTYKNIELFNFYIFNFTLFNTPLLFLRYNVEENINISIETFFPYNNILATEKNENIIKERLENGLKDLYNKKYEKEIETYLKKIFVNIPILNFKFVYNLKLSDDNKSIHYLKLPKIKFVENKNIEKDINLQNNKNNKNNSAAPRRAWISPSFRSFDIEYPECGAAGLTEGCWSLRKTPKKYFKFIHKYINNFIKIYDNNQFITNNISKSKINQDKFRIIEKLYKNKIPELDKSAKTSALEFKTIDYENINYEQTLNDLINLETVFFDYINTLPVFKLFIKHFGKIVYHNIGSANESLLINNLVNGLEYSYLEEDYTGSYHLWITCPYYKNMPYQDFLEIHSTLANKLQLLEPLFAAHFSSPPYEFPSGLKQSKSSLRQFLNNYSSYGTSDITLLNGTEKHIINQYYLSEYDIINNKVFVLNSPITDKIYVNDAKNIKTKPKINYDGLTTRNNTNNLFMEIDKGSNLSHKNMINTHDNPINYFSLLFEKTNIRPKYTVTQNNGTEIYKLNLGSDIRTRSFEKYIYPLDKSYIPKILFKNNKFLEVYYHPEKNTILYERPYDKSSNKNINNKNINNNRIGIEFRVLDHFPTIYLNQILGLLGPLVIDSIKNPKKLKFNDTHVAQQFWHDEMFNVIIKGYEYNVSSIYKNVIEKELDIKIFQKQYSSENVLQYIYENLMHKYNQLYISPNTIYQKIRYKSPINFINFNKIAWKEILNIYFEKNPFLLKKLKSYESKKNTPNNQNKITNKMIIDIYGEKYQYNLEKMKNYIKNLNINKTNSKYKKSNHII
jgi:hypothetical protein